MLFFRKLRPCIALFRAQIGLYFFWLEFKQGIPKEVDSSLEAARV